MVKPRVYAGGDSPCMLAKTFTYRPIVTQSKTTSEAFQFHVLSSLIGKLCLHRFKYKFNSYSNRLLFNN